MKYKATILVKLYDTIGLIADLVTVLRFVHLYFQFLIETAFGNDLPSVVFVSLVIEKLS